MEGCQLSKSEITGCRVSLYPMKDGFSPQILRSVEQTETSAVWSQTDLFSTLYRGTAQNVVDAAGALFINAYEGTTHMVGEFTFSKGCPGDTEADSFLSLENTCPNEQAIANKGEFLVHCKFSFYTFGTDEYMSKIAHIVDLAKEMGLQPKSAHYVTIVTGTASQLFTYFERALAYAKANLAHYVLEATVSVNSPSLKEDNHG